MLNNAPVTATSSCDECGKFVENWPAGLVMIDREQGAFTSDHIACPDCTPDVVTGTVRMIRKGVVFTRINYYWNYRGAQ